ncbi:hypothetical protein [Geoalkalibacter subterraneus]|uniref:hypothetical protein n=1 Tax=Geoalkalibacter subterraneus TaxID=483547 RepID=UPI00118657C3|nr:hypothetical protein [Geoalkalibacter subterraneus]
MFARPWDWISFSGFALWRERSERARDGLDFDGEMGPLRPKWRSFLVYCVVETDGWLGPTPQGRDEDVLGELSTVYLEARYPSDFGLLPHGRPLPSDIARYRQAVKAIYDKISCFLEKP